MESFPHTIGDKIVFGIYLPNILLLSLEPKKWTGETRTNPTQFTFVILVSKRLTFFSEA